MWDQKRPQNTERMNTGMAQGFGPPLYTPYAESSQQQMGYNPNQYLAITANTPQMYASMSGQNSSGGQLSEQNIEALKEQKLRQFLTQLDYISPNLGLNYLPSPLLRYRYPSATPEIVTRIGRILLYYPRFYIQVLHLMNKMSLPVPFQPLGPEENIEGIERFFSNHLKSSPTVLKNDLSDDESELEEDSDQQMRPQFDNKINKKLFKSMRKSNKKLKTGFVGEKVKHLAQDFEPKRKQKNKTNDELTKVFELQDICSQKQNISVNIVSDYNQIRERSKTTISEVSDKSIGFGLISADHQKPPKTTTEIVWNKRDLITDEELAANQLPKSEWCKHSALKNYSPGEPSVRLYLKNIDKNVSKVDLIRIFAKFIDCESEEHRNMFDIQLMKSGRMKGQAFVTLADEKSAETALNQTNGYLFNGKPIVVAFARSRKTSKDSHLDGNK